jgi:transcription elongation factor GreA
VSKVPLTVRGAERLREEHKKLKGTDRPKVIQAIAEARAHAARKEAAAYHAPREQQGFIEGRIQDIEGKLSNAEIIDVTQMNANGKVIFGATVRLADEDSGNEVTYQIVGEDEADIKAHRISINSPIARGLIGKEEGDVVAIRTPAGEKQFEIVEVKYE